MFNPILDGILVFDLYKWNIAVLLIVMIGPGIWVVDKLGIAEKQDPWLKLAFAFAIGPAVFDLFAFLLVVMGFLWPATHKFASLLLLGLAFVLLISGVFPHRRELTSRRVIPILLSLFLLLIVRLAYLRSLILPPYSDSVIHYQIIAGFLDPALSEGFNLSLKNIFIHYYHFGFHAMAAWLASLTGTSIGDSISIFGPLFLVIAPVSTGLLAYILTRSRGAAFFSALLTAVGWSMPAFSINWGKFPALGAISIVPAVLAVILYCRENSLKKPGKVLILILLVGGVALLHSRALIFLSLAGIVVWIVGKIGMDQETSFFQSFRFTLLFILSLLPLFELLSGFYKGIWFFLPVLVFAFRTHPKVSIGVFLFTFGLWLIMKSSQVMFGEDGDIIDRQFLQMSMALPLSLIGGAGLHGMIHYIALLKGGKVSVLAGATLAVGLMVNFFIQGAFYPDRCCNYFTKDDQTAMQWIQDNTPPNSLFLISTFQNENRASGTDGGMWLGALTGRPTNKIPFNVTWESPIGMNAMCPSSNGPVYIYAGGGEFGFADKPLKNTGQFQAVFQSGDTTVYQVVNCPH
jgi:hypothetical protein